MDLIIGIIQFIKGCPFIPFLLLFAINNLVLYRAWRNDKLYKAKVLVKLKEEAKTEKRKCTDDELEDEIKPQTSFTWTFCICVCLDIWMLGAFFTHLWAAQYFTEVKEEDSNKALFGDSFGAVNALISAFAFAGMLVAFFLQRYELRLQRKELQLTRDEMNDQTRQFELQNKTLQVQRFENTLFNMMELQQQIVNELSTNQTEEIRKDMWAGGVSLSKDFPVDENISGRNLFYHAFCNIIHEMHYDNTDMVEKLRGMKEVLEKWGRSYYEEMATPTYFDHYFRHLYTILKFIDKEDEKEGDKRLFTEVELYGYAKILRATLSRYELVWLYYNGLSSYGQDKLKPLIERYCLLNNLREDLLGCSKENRKELSKICLSPDQVKNDGYSGTDYEFFLTAEHGDKTKYHISAFFNTNKELADAEKKINDWNNYLEVNRKLSIV